MSDHSKQGEGKGRLSSAEAARLTDQVASLARAGLPLGPGLVALGEELPPGKFRRSLFDLAEALSKGTSLDTAIEEQKDRIPPHLRGLVVAGLRTGNLGDILGRFSGYVSIGAELWRKLWLSMVYPIASIIAALALFVFVNVVLVGQFEAIFRDFGIPLPKLTIAMIVVSHVMREAWPALATLGGAIIVFWLFSRAILAEPQRRALACSLPLVGRVWRYTSWAEFCHLLALLLESRLPLPEALRLTGEGVQNSTLERACRYMANDVERGSTLAEAMFARSEFPKGLPRLLKWAKDPGSIAEILHMAGEMFEPRAKGQATYAGTVMAVLALIMVLWGITTVILGLMLPLITLISKLSG